MRIFNYRYKLYIGMSMRIYSNFDYGNEGWMLILNQIYSEYIVQMDYQIGILHVVFIIKFCPFVLCCCFILLEENLNTNGHNVTSGMIK